MFLRDEPDTSSEGQARMPELLEDYRVGRGRLITQARELERLRHQVRASAEREAAAIVTTARSNVRQVLLDARRELLVLVAQLQAVGCDQPADDSSRSIVEGEATASSVDGNASAGSADAAAGTAEEIVSGTRREVREVLLEAQTELLALAEEARELRARIARQHGSLPEAPAAAGPAPDISVAAEVERSEPETLARFVEGPAEYVPLSATSRIWIPVAAAVIFASGALYLWMSQRGTAPSRPAAQPAVAQAPQTPTEPLAAPEAPEAAPQPSPIAAADRATLAVTIEARRPAWIRTTVDGRADLGRTFSAGETRTVTARDEIVMRAGDAGAVLVSLNGAEARPLGADGQVVTRRFGAAAPVAKAPLLQAVATKEAPASADEGSTADVGTTGTREAGAGAAGGAVPAEREILRAAQQWFEAYFGGDSAGMKQIETADFSIVDDRNANQRLSATMRGVDRGLQQVQIDVAGDGAVMSARLTERATIDGQHREFVSLVSGVWIRTDGRWRLTGLRFVDPSGISM